MVAIISCAVCAVSVVVSLVALALSRKDVGEKDREDFYQIQYKLDEISRNITEIRVEQKTLSQRVNQMDKELYKLQSDVNTAFIRIDELKEEIR